MSVIDFHCHIVPETIPSDPTGLGTKLWPSMRPDGPGRCMCMIENKDYRPLDDRSWSVPRRLEDMEEEGIAMQVLSPMPELLSYWFAPKATQALGRYINGVIADMVAQAPDKFIGLGMVPLQDPELAAEELRIIKDEFGLCGVEIGTHVNGKSVGDPFFDPFYAAAEDLGMRIFVHAMHPIGNARLAGQIPTLSGLIGNPADSSFAVASLITGGTLIRYPKLQIAFSHGGGGAGSMLPRLAHGWSINDRFKEMVPESPWHYARQFYYDTLVYDTVYLNYLIKALGADRLLLGTDYPYVLRQSFPGTFVKTADASAADIDLMLFGNARRFLGLD